MDSMIRSDLPTVRSGTHVVFDSIAQGRLEEIGAVNVVRASDNLLVGPSRREAAEHARARELWWGSSGHEIWDQLGVLVVGSALPIVLWVAASLQERIHLWRALHGLRRIGIAHRDVLVVELEPVPSRGALTPPGPLFDCTQSVAHHSSEVLLERLSAARPWPRARHDRAVQLWEKYVDVDPLPLVRACRRGVGGFPELAPLWAFLSSFFPRRTQDGALRPGLFDDLLLSVLSSDWQTPVSLFVHDSEAGEELRQMLSCTGDLFLPRRLEQWAQHGPDVAVERSAGPKADERMLSFVYRITERGKDLRARGLARLSDAPGLSLAGTEVYSPSVPWELLEDGRLVRSRPAAE